MDIKQPEDETEQPVESEDSFDTDDDELDDEEEPQNNMSGSNDDLRGLVGLQNLGNTCYINGALQALSNCQQLTRFVLDCPGFLREKGLCQSYSELIKEMWISRTSHYAAPTSIIRNIKCIYPAFRGCTQQDTQEFLRCFLEQLHDELKQPVRKERRVIKRRRNKPTTSGDERAEEEEEEEDGNVVDDNDDGGDDDDDDETKQEPTGGVNSCSTTKREEAQQQQQTSIISDTFEFKISSSVVCSSCNNISTTIETFKDLSVPIPSRDHPYYQSPPSPPPTPVNNNQQNNKNSTEIMDNNNNTNNQSWLSYFSNWFWGPQVTLYDCLSIFFGTDPLEGDNEYSCEVCTKKNRGVKFLKISELPEVLCIHFKRYESIGSAKITTHVSFPLTGLDLQPFMSENSRQQCTTYNLIACICHHGSALLTGHYTTYALNCYDDQWYEFDDQYVTNVQNYQVENSEAYILFYQKSTLDDRTDRQRVKASKLLKKSLNETNMKRFFISKQWVNKFNTFVEPGPITNYDFLCEHEKVSKSNQANVSELCHPISETVWRYLRKLHGGGPECQELIGCDFCE